MKKILFTLFITLGTAVALHASDAHVKTSFSFEGLDGGNDFCQSRYGTRFDFSAGNPEGLLFFQSFTGEIKKTQEKDSPLTPETLYNMGSFSQIQLPSFQLMTGIRSVSDQPFHSTEEIRFFSAALIPVYQSPSQRLSIGAVYLSEIPIQGFPRIPIPFLDYTLIFEKGALFLGFQSGFQIQWTSFLSSKISVPLFSGDYLADISLQFSKAYKLSVLIKSRNQESKPVARPEKSLYLKQQGWEAGMEFQKKSAPAGFSAFAGYTFANEIFWQEYVPLGGERKKFQKKTLPDSWVIRGSVSFEF